MKNLKRYLYPFAMLIGTVIGVGLFGLPYVASQAGILVILAYFIVIGVVIYFVQSIYGSVIASSQPRLRIAGLMGEHLGVLGKHSMFVVAIITLSGTMLAYLVIGGQFAQQFFGHFFGGNYLVYVLAFFVVGAFLVFKDRSSIAQAESFMIVLFVVLVAILGIAGLGKYNFGELQRVSLVHLFLPYGVVIFSLWGTSIMPEVYEMCKGDIKLFKRVLLGALVFAIIFYLIFIFIVFSLSGANTTEDAISGLAVLLPSKIILLAYCFGLLTCFTSFITMGLNLKKIYWYDYKVNRHFSWALACFVPLILFFAGLKDFLQIIGLIGGIALGIVGIMIFLAYLRLQKRKASVAKMLMRVPRAVVYLLLVIFVLGVALEIYFSLT